jgi:lipoprotein-anchoring transpeptidase ErfK/SrfK
MRNGRVTIALLLLAAQIGAAAGNELARHSSPAFDAATINSDSQSELRKGEKGPGVVRAEILLDRAHFSCGEIDGDFGVNLEKTVIAFQRDRGLQPSGSINQATWDRLNTDHAPPLFSYTISTDDVTGPFADSIPARLMDQASLPALGYTSPLEELAERFHSSPALLRALNPGADFASAGQQITVPNLLTMPRGSAAARIVISKSETSVRAYDAAGRLLAFYVATIGSQYDPLPVGGWKVRSVAHNPVFHYNPDLFWDAADSDEKATLKPGPNNPVGLVWIDLSKEHYGIHGTPEPSRIGHTASHGCIRLTNWDAVELAGMVRPGTPAILKE